MKQKICYILTLLLVSSLVTVKAQSTTEKIKFGFSFTPSSPSYQIGEFTEVGINFSNPNNIEIGGMQFTLKTGKNLVLKSISKGDAIKDAEYQFFPADLSVFPAGTYNIMLLNNNYLKPLAISGNLATLSVECVDDIAGESYIKILPDNLNISNQEGDNLLDGENTDVTIEDSQVSTPPTPVLTFDPDNFTITSGRTATFNISLSEEATFAGLNLDLTLPTGISVESVKPIGELSGWTTSFNALSSTSTRLTAFNLINDITTSGNIIQLTLKASEELTTPGSGNITISNIDFSTKTGKEFSGEGSEATCNILIASSSIAIDPSSWIMKVDETKQLNVIFTPEGTSDKTVTWSTNQPTICSVNDGLIKAINVGSATITAQDTYGNTATCEVTVSPVTPTSVTLTPPSASLIVGEKITLSAVVQPDNVTDKTITWKSENQSVATVGTQGEVTALSKGITTITATCGSVSAECQVTVYDNTDITVNPGNGTTEGDEDDTPAGNTQSGGSLNGSDLTLRINQKGVISLKLPDGLTQTPTLEWSLAPGGDTYVLLQKINNVEASFTGRAMGVTTYYVKIQGETDPIIQGKITVIGQNPMTALSLNPPEITVAENALPFTITATYDPTTADADLLEWSNSLPAIAEMTKSSPTTVTITPGTKGETIITVKANDGSELTSQCKVTVTAPVDEDFNFDFDDATMNGVDGIDIYIGNTYQLKPKAQDGKDLPANITWTSSDTQTVSVTNDGTVSGLKIGSATITASATFNGKTLSASCTVNVLPILASTIKLSTENLSLFVGQTASLTAEVEPQNTTDKTITWESDNPSVASVTDGKISGLKANPTPVNITAKCGNATATCSVTVSGNENVEILPGNGTTEGDEDDTPADNTEGNGSLIGNNLTLRVGQTASITVHLPDDLSVNPELDWSLAEGGEEFVTMQVDQNTLGASFTGVKMGTTYYSISLQEGDEAITGGTITVIAQTPVTSLELEPNSLSLAQNSDPVQLTPKFTPANASEIQFSWSSSMPTVATVSNDGLVTPVNPGEAIITTTANDGSELKAMATITVTKPVDNNFGFNFDDAAMGGVNGISIYLGDTYQLQPSAKDGYDLPEGITWSSSNPQTVSVEPDGTVKGLHLGSAQITATATFNGDELSASCTVTVIAVPAQEIQLNTKDATIYIGESVTIEATVKPDNTTYPAVTWSSNNTGVATVDANGKVTGVSDGKATITAKSGNVEAFCTINVKAIEATDIDMTIKDVALLLGQQTTLSAKVLPTNTTYPTITWTSEDNKIVTVNSNGTITAVGVGSTTITATCGAVSATCKVTVNPVPAESIELQVQDLTLLVGGSAIIPAKVLPANTTYPAISWNSSDTSIATVTSDGTVTGLSVGTAIISATCGTVSATCKVTVNPVISTNLTLNTESITLLVEATYTLKASISPDNTTDKTLAWSSDNESVATVSSNGLVTAVSPGTAKITVKNGNNTATCKVTVNPITSTAITINVEDITLTVGASTTLTATVTPNNTTDKTLAWTSSDPDVATVNSNGLVTALAPGTATITVKNGNASATCKVTVLSESVTSITLNIEDQTIYVSATTQLQATVSPDNVTSPQISWTSDNSVVATVDSNGLVTGMSAGSATITATCDDASATCVITVIAREDISSIKVTTSNLNVVTMDGEQVLMWVSTEGGNPDGWSFSWLYNGEETSTEKNLEITAHNTNDVPVTESYTVSVVNRNALETLYSETFVFNIEILPGIQSPFGEDADNEDLVGNNAGTTEDENGWWERNGIHVETLKTREGSLVGMWIDEPDGGYSNGWEYNWTITGNEIGQGQSIEYLSAMPSGDAMKIDSQTPLVTLENYGPNGDMWYKASAYGPTIDVYRRPVTPLQMLRKGDGSSHTFIVMMSLTDAEINDYGYEFVYGYTDATGNTNIIGETSLRYCRADEAVYRNSENNFWVYSIWHYSDGSVVTSGLRYLDGSVDEDFNASTFNGEGIVNLPGQGISRTTIYTVDGQYMGKDSERLAPGIYIRQVITNGVSTSEKFIVR